MSPSTVSRSRAWPTLTRPCPSSLLVRGLVQLRHIERRFEAADHAVHAGSQIVRPNPSAVRPKNFVIGRAGEGASVLQGECNAIADPLGDKRSLSLGHDPAVG